jgi:predicted nuclease of predicted toxin-antitoxin system
MGVSPRVVAWLRAGGHDAADLREQQLHRLPDDEVFAKAVSEKRVLLTFDLDFGEIVGLGIQAGSSVIVFRLRNTRVDFVIERLRTCSSSPLKRSKPARSSRSRTVGIACATFRSSAQ